MSECSKLDDTSIHLKRGEYHPPSPTALRGPCPMVNALANHGYIPRSGRSITAAEMSTALREAGLSLSFRSILADLGWLEHHDAPPTSTGAYILHPLASLFGKLGMRRPGQVNARGDRVLDLDQLSLHTAVEHDVSLTRRDAAQGDNHTPQQDLVAGLMASSSDGEVVTTEDFARLRHARLERQRRDNPTLEFGMLQQTLARAEVALLQTIFGEGRKGYAVPVGYLRVFFEEERLPVEEGWRKRSWWWQRLGFWELVRQGSVFQGVYDGVGKGS